MPSWEEIQQYARSNYKLAEDEENWFSLVFGYDSGRSQKIWVRKFEAMDGEWLEFRSVVCKLDEMTPIVALRKNRQFVVGSLGLDKDDDYVFIHNAPLDSMDLDEFERPLHVVAHTADQLESQYAAEDDKW
ncbi:MAG: hypothetical protein H6742_17225 [Alphaproteobacteria bacterium]|nr:hypothetical protein [Alphaproteobacteria bacterium]